MPPLLHDTYIWFGTPERRVDLTVYIQRCGGFQHPMASDMRGHQMGYNKLNSAFLDIRESTWPFLILLFHPS